MNGLPRRVLARGLRLRVLSGSLTISVLADDDVVI